MNSVFLEIALAPSFIHNPPPETSATLFFKVIEIMLIEVEVVDNDFLSIKIPPPDFFVVHFLISMLVMTPDARLVYKPPPPLSA